MTEKNQYLYRLQPSRSDMFRTGMTDQESLILKQHYAYMQHLKEQGNLILAGRTQNPDESTFGIVIFEADSDDDAQMIMGNDPAVNLGIYNAWLFPFKTALER